MKKGSYAYTLIFIDAAEGHFLKITMIWRKNRMEKCANVTA